MNHQAQSAQTQAQILSLNFSVQYFLMLIPPNNKPVRPKKNNLVATVRVGKNSHPGGRDSFFLTNCLVYNIWHYMYTIKDKQGKLLIFSLAKLDNMNVQEWIIGHKKFAISSSIIAQVYVQIIYNQENASLFQMLSEKK